MTHRLKCKRTIPDFGVPVLKEGQHYDIWMSSIDVHDFVFRLVPAGQYIRYPMMTGMVTLKKAFGEKEVDNAFGKETMVKYVRDNVNIKKIKHDEEDIL